MKTPQENTQESQKETIQRVQQESSTGGEATITDNRPARAVQRKLRSGMDSAENTKASIQRKNNTGLPDTLKSGIENLSGYAMDDVKVHYNSSKSAQLQAHAYAQGTDIHLASGQEKHLPHEAWHVVQQKQGRVKPTMQLKSKVSINDDAGLEKEADIMGNKALKVTNKPTTSIHYKHISPENHDNIAQLKPLDTKINKKKLNIVGETHTDYNSENKKRDLEKKYSTKKFGSKLQSYWVENEIEHKKDIDTDDIFYGDSAALRYLDGLCHLLVIIGGYHEATNEKDQKELSDGIRNKVERLQITENKVRNYETDQSFRDVNLPNLKNDLSQKYGFEGLFKNIRNKQGLAFQYTLNKIKPEIEALVSKYYQGDSTAITAKNLYENRETYQDEPYSFSIRRGKHMQRFADNYGKQFKGIWKVGNAHIKQISDYEDSLGGFERTEYTLMDKATFGGLINYNNMGPFGKLFHNLKGTVKNKSDV
ncbi:DUF4157 domain-containing protein [uncultured Aquimarina sp.]|uniref:eCIS core domain-containing protein n=1 Tax=uncultured Aquimarina sp. TaxID=575652 RepID=UPI00260828E1|nr:DUF4157 domain-containing protein [uncultured Aquimarina sp.]